jgi:hypothetical protein
MAVRIKLGDYQTISDDCLGMGYISCFPRQPARRGIVPHPPVCLRLRPGNERNFALGHGLKAIQARIREHFGGSALALIRWIDKTHPYPAS